MHTSIAAQSHPL
uniref:Uncharacterized protein n=1 Tax=Rhizophora mucronata TaxID=61149 RepID=A0A2P2NA64_RHIMU